MAKVTYLGPIDSGDPTTRFRVPVEDPKADPGPDNDVVLRLGIEQTVSADLAKQLAEYRGHRFEIDGQSTDGMGKARTVAELSYEDMNNEQLVEQLHTRGITSKSRVANTDAIKMLRENDEQLAQAQAEGTSDTTPESPPGEPTAPEGGSE